MSTLSAQDFSLDGKRDQEAVSFSTLLGSEAAKRHLENALVSGQLSHAYLIEGAAGTGKKRLAFTLAKAILCEHPKEDGDACGACRSCRLMDHGSHPDFTFITYEGGTRSIQISQIRSELVEDVAILPYQSQRKVYVVDHADRMSTAAQNSLLKTIEEPPSYAVILLLCENVTAILPTILSRCVTVRTEPLTDTQLFRVLTREGADPSMAQLAVEFASGSLGRARTLLGDESFRSARSDLYSFLSRLPKTSDIDKLRAGELLGKTREDMERSLMLMTLFFRDVLVFQKTGDEEQIRCRDFADGIKAVSRRYAAPQLIEVLDGLSEALLSVRSNGNLALIADCVMMTLM